MDHFIIQIIGRFEINRKKVINIDTFYDNVLFDFIYEIFMNNCQSLKTSSGRTTKQQFLFSIQNSFHNRTTTITIGPISKQISITPAMQRNHILNNVIDVLTRLNQQIPNLRKKTTPSPKAKAQRNDFNLTRVVRRRALLDICILIRTNI